MIILDFRFAIFDLGMGDWIFQIQNKKGRPFGTAFQYLSRLIIIYFTFWTMALNAAGLFIAKSARTLRLISMLAPFNKPINWE